MIQKLLLFVRSFFFLKFKSFPDKALIPNVKLICLGLFFVISYANATNYYSKPSGDLRLTTSWGLNTDGTGTSPANFTAGNDIFYIQNSTTAVINGNWTVSGTNSKIVLGNGSSCNFTVGSNYLLTATMDISANATLTLTTTANTAVTFGTLSTTSTVNFAETGNQPVITASYGNLIVSGSGSKTVSGNITVNKDFTLTGGTFSLNNATNYVFTILGNYNQTGGILDFNAGTSGTSNMYLGGNLTNSAGGNSIFTAGNVKNGIITFNGTGIQTLNMPTNAAAVWVKYIVNAGRTLKLASNLTLNNADPSTQADWVGDITVNTGATIDFGTFQVSQSGGVGGSTVAAVVINSGANVISANVNGLDGSVSSTNINSTFSNAANYTFNGTSAQITGNLLPATVNNLSINNTSGVTLSKATTITNDFSLALGAIANLNTFTHSAKTLTVNGNGQNTGSWGSTASPATYRSSAYFGTTAVGILNATTVACTAGYWTGAISTDWNTASNWCGNTVPTNTTNVIIPAGTAYMPTIAAGTTAVVNNLTVNASASLSLSNNSTSLLNISGNFVSNGTFTAGATSTISFIGATQSVAGVTYSNLTLSGGTKTFAGNTIITNNLIVSSGAVINLNGITTHTAGTLTLNGSGPLTSTWGASGSGAANTNDTYFTGTGRITINGTPAYPAIDKNYASYTKGVYGKIANSYAEGANPVPQFTAPNGTVFINVDFASYGLPSGLPAPFTLGTCDAFNSRTIVTTFLGNTTASVPASNATFGDPCYSTVKRLSIQATYTEPICSGSSPGLISGSDPTGGNGAYAFSWSVSTTSAISGFTTIGGATSRDYTPGNISTTTWYKRTVTSGMYTSETIVVVHVNITPIAPTTITTPVSICAGNSTILTVSGGNKGGNGGFTQWFSGSCGGTLVGEGDSVTVSPTANTTYYARYKNGCTTTTCISTTVTASVSISTTAATDVCVKTTSQTTPLPYTVVTGTPTKYSIVWSNAPINSFVNVTDLPITSPISISVPANTATGTYTGTLSVKNASNCASFGNTFTVTVNALPVAPTASATSQPTCTVSTGTIAITAPSPGAGITYSIDGSTYTNTTGVFNNVAVGSYNVTTKNSSGCVSPATPININAASVKTWNGSSSTVWNTASNWTPSGVPTASDCVVIPNVTNKPIISADAFAQIITINNTSSLSVQSAYTLTVTDGITVGATGSLIFENHSALMQSNIAAVNTGNITYKRIAVQIRRGDFVYWSTPVSPQKLFDVSPLTLYDKYFGFSGDDWVETNSNTTMVIGKGYIIRAPQNYSITAKADYEASFIGTPNNGNLSGETLLASKTYLIGNPYPSALDAKKFLGANLFLDGTLYFWTHNTPVNLVGEYQYDGYDYAAYNSTGGTATYPAPSGSTPGNDNRTPSGKIGAGQSFFATTNAGGTVAFNNTMRLGGTDNTQFFKPGKTAKETTTNRVWLNMTNEGGLFKQMLIGYIEGATNDYESRFDGVSFDGNPYLDFYSLNNASKFVIQGRALPFTDTDTVPLGYRTTVEGKFTISIEEADGDLSNQDIYLEDKATGKINDLKASNYTFTTGIGDFTDRFVLRYTNKTLGVGDIENQDNNILVSVKDKVIKVTSTKENIKRVTLFDVSGKQLYDKNKVGTTELQLQNLPISNQVLLVNITLENGFMTTKKIIFK